MRAWDFHPDVGLVLVGGVLETYFSVINGTEISEDYGVTFRELAPLPKYATTGCAVIVDERTVYHIGGYYGCMSIS